MSREFKQKVKRRCTQLCKGRIISVLANSVVLVKMVDNLIDNPQERSANQPWFHNQNKTDIFWQEIIVYY